MVLKGVRKQRSNQIIEYVQKLKLEAQNGKSLNELLPESFALVREASKRTLDQSILTFS